MQYVTVRVNVAVILLVVGHIFDPVRIAFVLSCFADLIILRLDEALLTVFFEIQIILLALISRIRYDLFDFPLRMPFYAVQERDQGLYVCTVGECSQADNKLTLHTDLDMISCLSLTVFHMVFLHPHEGGVGIGLGITAPIPANLQMVFILFFLARIVKSSAKIFRKKLLQETSSPGIYVGACSKEKRWHPHPIE